MSTYDESSVPEQQGKTFFVTGANTGIGFEVARVLSGRGARVLLGCRSEEKAKRAIEKIRRQHPNSDFTFELARRCEARGLDVTSLACHPGVADTELSRTFPVWFWIVAPIIRPFFNTPAEGALPTLLAATSPDAKPMDYYGPVKRRETARSAGRAAIADHVRDEAVASKLWDMSIQLTGVSCLTS